MNKGYKAPQPSKEPSIPTKEGMYIGLDNDLYHADRKMVSKSWLDRVAKHPLNLRQYLDGAFDKTLALTIGSAVDCLIFEPEKFDSLFVKSPLDKKNTKVGKAAWEEAYSDAAKSGRTIIECHLTDHWTTVFEMSDAIKANGLMNEFLQDGVGQAVFVTRDEATGLLVKCKTDHFHKGSSTIIDLKTAENASPFEFGRSIANYRYNVQDAFYSDIVSKVLKLEEVRFLFAVMEKPKKDVKPDPRMMAFYELTQEEKSAGRNTYQSDLAAIGFAIDTNNWAGYPEQVISIERPGWAKSRDE